MLVATTTGSLYAFNVSHPNHHAAEEAPGEMATAVVPCRLWRYRAGAPLFATPAVDAAAGVAVVPSVSGTIVGVGLDDGTARWTVLCPRAVFSSPSMINATMPVSSSSGSCGSESPGLFVVGCHDGTVTCRETATGRRKWSTNLADSTLSLLQKLDGSRSTPSPQDGGLRSGAGSGSDPIFSSPFVFGLESPPSCPLYVVAASQHGILAVLDLQTGAPVAATKLNGQIFSSPVVVQNKSAAAAWTIYIGCRDDYLYAIDVRAS